MYASFLQVKRLKTKGRFKYDNEHYGFPVMTAQEKELIFNDSVNITQPDAGMFEEDCSDKPQRKYCEKN